MLGWRSGVETCWRWWTSRTSAGGRPANCPVRRPALASFLPPADSRGEEQKIQAAHQDATSSDPDVQQHVQQKQCENAELGFPSSFFCLPLSASRGSSGGTSHPTSTPASGPVSTRHHRHLPLVSARGRRCDVVLCVDPLTPVADQGGCRRQSVAACGRVFTSSAVFFVI